MVLLLLWLIHQLFIFCQNINKFPVHLTSSRPLLVNVDQWLNSYLIIILLLTSPLVTTPTFHCPIKCWWMRASPAPRFMTSHSCLTGVCISDYWSIKSCVCSQNADWRWTFLNTWIWMRSTSLMIYPWVRLVMITSDRTDLTSYTFSFSPHSLKHF